MEEKMPRDETIKKWVLNKNKKDFEKEVDLRLKTIERDYIKKRNKLLYIKKRLNYI